ncbi:hypothetical protein GOV09_03915 [Candidatus Woesearchaeota archaeon]|nr:hypothetical protein [Candidatus Woesearchaeota archaeon]
MKSEVIELLKKYTGKRTVYLTQRGNKSIFLALKIVKAMGMTKIIVQDQGGWITYPQYIDRLKLQMVELKTDYGLFDMNSLGKSLDGESAVLVNGLSGYFADQPMGMINSLCKQKNALLINDASGSIGTEIARYGDIVIGSFGEDKPVNLQYGGFLAFDELDFDKGILDDAVFDADKIQRLADKLKQLPERLKFFEKHTHKIKKELAEFEILHSDRKGLNVIVKYKDDHERERIIKYCEKGGYQYVECPRYHKVNVPAISIEVKRLK